jgi:hypothetical protein
MDVGDDQFRGKVMESGLAQYKGTSMQEEVLSYPDQIFDADFGESFVSVR